MSLDSHTVEERERLGLLLESLELNAGRQQEGALRTLVLQGTAISWIVISKQAKAYLTAHHGIHVATELLIALLAVMDVGQRARGFTHVRRHVKALSEYRGDASGNHSGYALAHWRVLMWLAMTLAVWALLIIFIHLPA